MYLRPYRNADLDAIFALDRVCFSPRFRFSRMMMRRTVEAAGAVVLMACDAAPNGAERLLGFCAVQIEGGGGGLRLGYVSTLDVAPETRGRGVGEALMRAVQEHVSQAGAESMLLHVFVENLQAVRLYERLGYACVAREHGFYGPGFDAWVYRKELGGSVTAAER